MITFNNSIKVCFYSKIQTQTTQIGNSIFIIKNPVLTGFLKIIGGQSSPIKFGSALEHIKIMKVCYHTQHTDISKIIKRSS